MLTNLSTSLNNILSEGVFRKKGKEYPIYAHRNGKKELYSEHCEKTWIAFKHILESENVIVRLFNKIKAEYGFDLSYRAFQNLLRELVFFHDIGKVSPRFQIERMKNTSLNGLIGESELSKTYRQHSFPGAFLFTVHLSEKYDLEENPILLIFPFMILSHHTRLKNPHQAYSRKEIKDFRNTIYTLFDLLDIEKQKIGAVPYALCKDGFPTRLNYDRAEVSILYNYLFSCLIKADSIATSYADTDTQAVTENLEKIEERISPSLYNRMQSAYEKKQKEFERKRREETGRKKKIDQQRQKMFEEAETNLSAFLDQGKRVFYLKMPTGGGKTNTSLGLSLKIMEEKEVNRLIYALPYISILEQNYGRLKESLDLSEPSEVRKIHSSTETIFEEEKKNAVKRKIKKIVTDDDFFNYPVICTTNVAFFNAIVKFAKKRKYRFSSLANSIVILDEIQTLPPEYWPEFNFLINELAESLNMYFIIMSATVPKLEKLKSARGQDPKYQGEISYLIEDPEKYYMKFERNKILTEKPKTFDIVDEKGKERLRKHLEQICQDNFEERRNHGLIVLNTIKTSRYIYEIMKDLSEENKWEADVRLLNSTFLPIYKRGMEEQIGNLKEGKKFILVSTQTIEAGMDISFDFVIRDFAILDSIEQVRGRCNRERERDTGNVYLIKIRKGTLYDHKMIYINWRIEKTEKILENTLQYEFSDVEDYYDWLVDHINSKMEDRFSFTAADNIKNFCRLNFERRDSPENRRSDVFHVDVIEKNRKTFSFFVAIDAPIEQFTDKEVAYLRAKERESGLKLISNQKVIGGHVIKYYDKKVSELKGFEERKIFRKEMLSILSKFTFSTTLNVDERYGDTEELLDTLFEENRVGPFYVIDRDRIGDEVDDWYSLTQGFHHEFERTGKHSNII